MKTPNTQMEINFVNNLVIHQAPRRRTRMERAQWWFAHIRQVVNAASTLHPVPAPRPIQEHLEIAA